MHDQRSLHARIAKLLGQVAANDPTDVLRYLSQIGPERHNIAEAMVPSLSQLFQSRKSDGLFVPAEYLEQRWPSSVGVYMTLDEYALEFEDVPRELIVDALIQTQPRHIHLESLALLNLAVLHSKVLQDLQDAYRSVLRPYVREQFDYALRPKQGAPPLIFLNAASNPSDYSTGACGTRIRSRYQ